MKTNVKPTFRRFSIVSARAIERLDHVFYDWIDQPIKCGYLRAFSEYEYSSENIDFLIAVDKFRDFLSMYYN